MNDMFEKAASFFLICASLLMLLIFGMAIYMIATGKMPPSPSS